MLRSDNMLRLCWNADAALTFQLYRLVSHSRLPFSVIHTLTPSPSCPTQKRSGVDETGHACSTKRFQKHIRSECQRTVDAHVLFSSLSLSLSRARSLFLSLSLSFFLSLSLSVSVSLSLSLSLSLSILHTYLSSYSMV